ncbi:MAG TPA: hypothetical protein VI981_00535 [Candidatus Paceibacterota bacterium]
MDHQKRLQFLGIIALICFFFALVVLWPERFGLCNEADRTCIYGYLNYESTSVSVLLFSLSILLCSIVLYFLRQGVYRAWTKFMLWWIPFSVILIALTPSYGGSGLDGGVPGLDREMIIWLAASAFFIISLAIIAWKSFQLRRK